MSNDDDDNIPWAAAVTAACIAFTLLLILGAILFGSGES
jgi:hypothetical protein